MKKQIRKWFLRITATVLLIVTILLVIVLNPGLSYANKTTHHNFKIYHSQPVEQSFLVHLDEAAALLSTSEYNNPNLELDICMNDGSKYPWLIGKIGGQAFARGFYNKVVMMSRVNSKENYAEINGRKWNLTELLAHEMIHCLQFSHLGFWHSNPVAKIPNWKWEGYPEYIARRSTAMSDLSQAITRWVSYNQEQPTSGWMDLPDGTGEPTAYYKNWLLVKYCMDIKNMSYTELLADNKTEEELWVEMMVWYQQQQAQNK